jgi:hypothetical protein
LSSPNQQLRIIGGAILLRDQDEDGLGWKVGITSTGISAKLLTSGRVDTGVVQIMNGNEPCFRWDAFGITAYSFESENNDGYITNLDTSRGVRFDRFGIYGYDGPDGATWHPGSVGAVLDDSLFALTWDGLFIKLGNATYAQDGKTIKHSSSAKIGKVENKIYNSWGKDGLPFYDPDKKDGTFVKIFAAGRSADASDNNEELVIYDDGTLTANNVKLTGTVEWTAASSPSKSVYCTSAFLDSGIKLPDPGFDFPETDETGGWHTIYSSNDSYYAHTDDGGKTWQGPFLITGRTIINQTIEYAAAAQGTEPSAIEEWSEDRPSLVDLKPNEVVYIKVVDNFSDGSASEPRYSIDGGRAIDIGLSRTSSSIPTGPTGEYDQGLLESLSLVEVTVEDGANNITNEVSYNWTAVGGTLTNANTYKMHLNTMEENSATMTVTVSYGGKTLGTRTFTISKSPQGNTVMAYIVSSAGTAFESEEVTDESEKTTTLEAFVLENGNAKTDLTYTWYYEGGSSLGQGKRIVVFLKDLVGRRVYFTAQSNNKE